MFYFNRAIQALLFGVSCECLAQTCHPWRSAVACLGPCVGVLLLALGPAWVWCLLLWPAWFLGPCLGPSAWPWGPCGVRRPLLLSLSSSPLLGPWGPAAGGQRNQTVGDESAQRKSRNCKVDCECGHRLFWLTSTIPASYVFFVASMLGHTASLSRGSTRPFGHLTQLFVCSGAVENAPLHDSLN